MSGRPLISALFILLTSLPLRAVEQESLANIMTTTSIDGVPVEIRRSGDGVYPLIIFSHGMGGCPSGVDGMQSRLANAGYIVVAPKHADCIERRITPDVSWRKPREWTDQTNSDRRDDIHKILDALPSTGYAKHIESVDQVGCLGHSMGGYSCMGLAGAWESWKRDEVIAIALLSPWHKPYAEQKQIKRIANVRTLFQGGSKDRPITPDLAKPNGAYDQTPSPKYLQIFKRARHSSWTDRPLSERFHKEMTYYIESFFDVALKGESEGKLEVKKALVTELKFEH
jgi:pimeloyl-ACP methyl ester carboxylesterase